MRALMASSVRLRKPVFYNRCLTCTFTVLSAMFRISPISALVAPVVISRSTSSSRSVSS